MNLDEFKTAFRSLRYEGWIRSLRRGPTGVGHTLEQRLGLSENNIGHPDLGEIELKDHRLKTSSLVTLFTFNRKAWKMKPLEAIKEFGTYDENNRLGMYFTLSRTPNGQGLFCHLDSQAISARHVNGRVVAEWPLEEVMKRFLKKMPALISVSAAFEMRGNVEWFKYERAQFLRGTSVKILRQQLEEGKVLLDLRLHDAGTHARNHGTGFRAYENNLPFLFSSVEELE